MTEPLLQVDGLRAHFFTKVGVVKAVDDVSFTLHRGEVLGLVGESGSGKSTLAYSIMGLVDRPGRIVGGRITLDGRDLTTLAAEQMRELRGNRMAMVFQDAMLALNPVLRIDTQMVEAVLAHHKVTRAAALDRAHEALAHVGMPAREAPLAAYPHQFSGGMRQRVAIAIALLNEPDLIIADEPATALDVTIQAEILDQVQKLTRETGTALIWIAHDLSRIAGLADRLCVMYAGRVVEQGATQDVLCVPRHPYTRGLLDSMPGNTPPGEKLKQIAGMMPSLIELPPGCAFRARCPHATAECAEAPPTTPQGAIGHSVRCFHPLPPLA